ncbi:hypothetical protein [Candidatus Nitrosotenuis cloacae]|uniref:hypothetical protein n=1 Tax=Candidatus Nitrosotenuis cloacae TaxID=1603555 RepID=UPI00227E9932|nr:hypothetical protein [Candidatus Nitrosotenuis cloacae]
MSAKQNKVKSLVLTLLDDGWSDKNLIYKKLQDECGISQAEARLACKEAKIDLMLKLKALQSGIIAL